MRKQGKFWDEVISRWHLLSEDQKEWVAKVGGAYAQGTRDGFNDGYIKGKLSGVLSVGAAYLLYTQWPKIKEFGRKVFCKEETYTEPEKTENDVFDDEIID
jgi:hypothetical protein